MVGCVGELREQQGASVTPILMGEWRTVQLSPAQSPLGQVLVHQRGKSIVVVPLKQMDHLVDGDVLQTAGGLLG